MQIKKIFSKITDTLYPTSMNSKVNEDHNFDCAKQQMNATTCNCIMLVRYAVEYVWPTKLLIKFPEMCDIEHSILHAQIFTVAGAVSP